MEKSNHCRLCDNQEFDIKTGSRCSLTSNKPEFDTSCLDILLTKKFEDKLKEVNVEYSKVRKLKTHAVFQSGLYTAMAVGIIIVGYSLGKYVFDKGVISTVPLIIMGAGLLSMSTAFGPINSYLSQMSIAKSNKEDVDGVISNYGIEYDIDVEFGREYHGTTEVKVDLKLKGITSFKNK